MSDFDMREHPVGLRFYVKTLLLSLHPWTRGAVVESSHVSFTSLAELTWPG